MSYLSKVFNSLSLSVRVCRPLISFNQLIQNYNKIYMVDTVLNLFTTNSHDLGIRVARGHNKEDNLEME
jgi:hypothetical protein